CVSVFGLYRLFFRCPSPLPPHHGQSVSFEADLRCLLGFAALNPTYTNFAGWASPTLHPDLFVGWGE
ncbi:MAG: hypothetical protein AB1560_12195, partial [Pseudomonadota bacterium]